MREVAVRTLARVGGSTSKMAPTRGHHTLMLAVDEREASGFPHVDLSMGLSECPHNVATVFLQSE